MIPPLSAQFDGASFARALEAAGLHAIDAEALVNYNARHFRRTIDGLQFGRICHASVAPTADLMTMRIAS